MTANQIAYWNYVENKRHNQAGEENTRTDLGIKRDTLSETQRHNKETEGVSWLNARETARHNLATEDLGNRQLGETNRHNIVTEGQTYQYNNELVRHNLASEANQRYATDRSYSAAIQSASMAAAANKYNADRSYAASVYGSDTISAANKSIAAGNRINQAQIAAANRKNQADIAAANNASQQQVAKIQGKWGLANTALKSGIDVAGRLVPGLLGGGSKVIGF